MKIVIVSLVLLAFTTSATNATLTQSNLYSTGDGLLTYDSVSGLEWMDMTETYSLFGSEVITNISVGGIWEGFYHATRDEVNTFWLNAGIPFTGGPAQPLYDPVGDLVSLLAGSDSSLRGLTSTSFGSNGLSGASLSTECHFDIFEGGDVCTGTAQLNSYFNNNYSNTASSDGGTWLARIATNPPSVTVATPIPVTTWFIGSVILGLVGSARLKPGLELKIP